MKALNELYSVKGVLCDTNDDGFSEKLRGKVIISSEASIVEKKVALNLCGRLGFESTAIDLPILSVDKELEDNDIFITLDKSVNESEIAEIFIEDGHLVVKGYSEDSLEYAGEYLSSCFPYIHHFGLDLDEIVKSISKNIKIQETMLKKIILNKNTNNVENLFIYIGCDDYKNIKKLIDSKIDEFYFDGVKKIQIHLNTEDSIEIINPEYKECFKKITKSLYQNNIKNMDKRKTDLSNLFSKEGLLIDTDNDFLPDYIDTVIVIPDNADANDILVASIVAVKIGLECLSIKYPLVIIEKEYTSDYKNPIFVGKTRKAKEIIGETDKTIIKLLEIEDNREVLIYGESKTFMEDVTKFISEIPKLSNSDDFNVDKLLEKLKYIAKGKSFEGQVAHLDNKFNEFAAKKELLNSKVQCYFSEHDLSGNEIELLEKHIMSNWDISKLSIANYLENEVVLNKKYDIPWEVDVFNNYLVEDIYPNIKRGDKVSLFGVLSEDIEVRKRLITDIRKEIEAKGASLEECNIFCSYKQGFSWITEYIIPKLKHKENIEKIIIKFKPFLPAGITEWNDEDGATPNLDDTRNDDENKWFDLPIRFLQELYPVDDVIESELKISRDNVIFESDENIDGTYEILTYNCEKSVVLQEGYSVSYSERPYLDEYKNIGKVHPNTGLIKVWINNELEIEKNIKTDLENVWEIYQNDVLTSCKEYINKVTDGNPTIDKQPFFNKLRLDIELSEPDFKLDSRKDLISSLDALHEDIYFVGLDFIKTFGMKETGKGFDEPGLILPVIKKRNGMKPYMEFSLLCEKYKAPTYLINSECFEINTDDEVDFQLHSIEFNNNKDILRIKVMSNSDKIISIFESYKKLFEKGIVKFEDRINYDIALDIHVNNEFKTCIHLNSFTERNQDNTDFESIDIDDIEIPTDEVIGYQQYIEIIKKLKRVDGLKVWKVCESYQNRDIYAIDLYCNCDSDLVSRTKMINNKPVYLINNRHHANEVSSTNAAFKTIRALLKDEKYREYLKKVNITIIPFENVDGGNIHYMLQKDNPEWKLHIARFNSVGKEFAREYFKEDTKYTESLALPRVWNKWLPDIVVDNHGVPSHEWDQQFSGYTSPWFKGFWLPRALFYGYFWYVDSEDYPMHKGLNESLQDAVADKMNSDEVISKWNADWKDRFNKYAHQWLPKLFPANYYKDLIFYWLPYKPNKDSWHVSHRFPWITAIDWTTEVSDETAQGEYMELCSHTHFMSNIATIELLSKANIEIIENRYLAEKETTIKRIRKRPLEY